MSRRKRNVTPAVPEADAPEAEALAPMPTVAAEVVPQPPDADALEAVELEVVDVTVAAEMLGQAEAEEYKPTSIEDYLEGGFSRDEAELMRRAELLAIHGPGYRESSDAPAYTVVCPRSTGFRRIGRHFTPTATTLLVSELTAKECAILDSPTDCKLLTITKNF